MKPAMKITSIPFLAVLLAFAPLVALAQDLGQGYTCSGTTILKKGKAVSLNKAKTAIQQKIDALGISKKNQNKKKALKAVKAALTKCTKGTGGGSETRVEIGSGSPIIVLRSRSVPKTTTCVIVGFVEFDAATPGSYTMASVVSRLNPSLPTLRTAPPNYDDNYVLVFSAKGFADMPFPAPKGKHQILIPSILQQTPSSNCAAKIEDLKTTYSAPVLIP
jgi:hypothetical protein